MPKRLPSGKTKRGTRPARARVPQTRPSAVSAEAPEVAEPAPAPVPAPARRPAAPARQSLLNSVSTARRPGPKAGPTLITDYSYVTSDLKRIGIVSAGAVVILVVLAFVIH